MAFGKEEFCEIPPLSERFAGFLIDWQFGVGHSNGSDQWDGSKLGEPFVSGAAFGEGNAPGGVMSLTEDGVTFLRMQDAGNPSSRTFGFPDPYSNRKMYFGRDISADGAPDTLLDDGVT